MNSVAAAQEVCRRGVVFEAQYFDAEPFYAATELPRYGDVTNAIGLAISRETATIRLGVVAAQGLHMMEERPTALKREKGAVRGA